MKRKKQNDKPSPPESENIIRLTKGRRKGLLRIFFSRVGIIIILILVQAELMLTVYNWLYDYFEWFSVLIWIFTVFMVLHLFMIDMDSTAKLTWLFLLMLLPVPTAVFMLFTENDWGHLLIKRRVGDLIDITKNKLKQDEDILKEDDIVRSSTDSLHRYINRSGCFPIYRNTDIKYFPLGEDKFKALIDELKKAEKFIFLEYFIIEEGYMWGSILKILADKVKQGVEVRVLYDGMCEIQLLSWDYPKRLEKLGIQCKPFSPITPLVSTHYNYRDHRKILVIDGKTAFSGGINLADEYINYTHPYGHWKDTAVMMKGEAAQSFTLMFLQMWNLNEKEPEWDKYIVPSTAKPSPGYVMPYCDCPLDEYKIGESVYLDILNRAKRYVHIMTPYLILDNELESALKFAAQRGVDVKLILPGIPDKKVVYALSKSNYKYLTDAGVKIFEYTPGFVHAKVFVSDDEKAVVGTINLDYRSLYHHFECAAYMYKTECVADIEEDYMKTLSVCRRVTNESIKHEKIGYKIAGSIMRLFAPLM